LTTVKARWRRENDMMAAKPKPSFGATLAMIKNLMAGHGLFSGLLLAVMLGAALAESLGLTLLLPLISRILGIDIGAGQGSEIAAAVDRITGFLPFTPSLEGLLALLFFAFLLKGVLLVAARAMGTFFALRLRQAWAVRIFDHYLHAEDSYLAKQRDGRMIHNVATETHHASRGVVRTLNFINKLILAVVLFVIMLIAHWQATLAIALLSGVLVFAVRAGTARYSLRYGQRRQELGQDISELAAEGLLNVRAIKLSGSQARLGAGLLDKLKGYTRTDSLFQVVSEIPLQMTEVSMIALVSVTLLALKNVLDVDLKETTALLGFFVILFQRLMTYVSYLMSQRMKITGDMPALTLVHDLVGNAPAREVLDQGAAFEGLAGDVVFRDVHFRYEDGTEVLSGLDLTIERGKTTAVIGPSGVGKSTLADLLLGFQRVQSGVVEINGQPLDHYALSTIRRRIGYVTQDAQIFSASIRDNIAMGRALSDAEIRAAAVRAHANEFIERLSDGYDTVVGNRGVSLSGGQRQRLAIARVIATAPDLYIFDEATSSLDSRSEKFIQQSMAELAADATVLIIAHRLSTIEHADAIYALDHGRARKVTFEDISGIGAE
jgi:subfamily B ATP-binding cassette protein MsbA